MTEIPSSSDPGVMLPSPSPVTAEHPAGNGRSASPSMPEKDSVPGYEIVRELGRGGMGVVYEARQVRLERTVALKMILAGAHAGDADLQRFHNEAEVIARLNHPHIVQIHEVGTHSGLPYLALEFCAGGSLARKLGGTPLPPREAAALVEKLAQAMQAAHEKGIVHRDLNPANVLLTEDGTPRITDFGLAKKLDQTARTATGAIVGTPSYMAPEQAGGKSKEVGPACDIYALGAILYECLTGRPPFKAATVMETLMQVVSDEPVSVRSLNGQVPLDLETICLKCLQKEPQRRYRSAVELAEELGRFQRGEPITARQVSPLERLGLWAKRRPAQAAACVLTLLAGLLGLFGATATLLWQRAESARDATEQARTQAEEARSQAEGAKQKEQVARQVAEGALAREQDAMERLRLATYAHRLELAYRDWQVNEVGRARELLEQCPKEYRHWEWDYVHRLCYAHLLELKGHKGSVTSCAFNPDGKRIVSGNGDTTLTVWDAQKGQELLSLKGHVGEINWCAYSPDSKRILSGSGDKTLKVWDAQTGKELFALKGHTGPVHCCAFSSDGKRILSGSGDNTLKEWDAQTGKELHSLKGHTASVACCAYSPDGKRIVSGDLDGSLKVWDVRSGMELLSLKGHNRAVTCSAWSPDGKRILSGSEDGTLKVRDAQKGQEVLAFKGHTEWVSCCSFSPDGKRILSGGRNLRHLVGEVLRKPGPSVQLTVWNAQTGQELRALKGHTEWVSCCSFSPDGKRILSGSDDGTLKVWDAQQDQEPLS